MNMLERIIDTKRMEVAAFGQPAETAGSVPIRPHLKERLMLGNGVIAEIKRASPSKGDIRVDVDIAAQARTYEGAGAAAISVLTDETYFKGSLADLELVADSVSLPILCKDFIIDKRQIDRARQAGASIILLIVAALDDRQLQELFDYAGDLDLEVLVEVHTEEELEKALAAGAELIGVNNRDLTDFSVSLERTEALASRFPFDGRHVLISESGIRTAEDARFVYSCGARGILVGESLMQTKDPARWIGEAKGVLSR